MAFGGIARFQGKPPSGLLPAGPSQAGARPEEFGTMTATPNGNQMSSMGEPSSAWDDFAQADGASMYGDDASNGGDFYSDYYNDTGMEDEFDMEGGQMNVEASRPAEPSPSGGLNLNARPTVDSNSTSAALPNDPIAAPNPGSNGGIFSSKLSNPGKGGGLFASKTRPSGMGGRAMDDRAAENEDPHTEHIPGSLPDTSEGLFSRNETIQGKGGGLFASKTKPSSTSDRATEDRVTEVSRNTNVPGSLPDTSGDPFSSNQPIQGKGGGIFSSKTKTKPSSIAADRTTEGRVAENSHEDHELKLPANNVSLMTQSAPSDTSQFPGQHPRKTGIALPGPMARPSFPKNAPVACKQPEAQDHQTRDNGRPATGFPIAMNSQSSRGSSVIAAADVDSTRILPVGPSVAVMTVTPTHTSRQNGVNQPDTPSHHQASVKQTENWRGAIQQDKPIEQRKSTVHFATPTAQDATPGYRGMPNTQVDHERVLATPTSQFIRGNHHATEPELGEITPSIPAVTPTAAELPLGLNDGQTHVQEKTYESTHMELPLASTLGISDEDRVIFMENEEQIHEGQGGNGEMSFEHQYAKFQSDLRELEEIQDRDKTQLLDLEVMLSTGHSISLGVLAGYHDDDQELDEAMRIGDEAITKYQSL